MPTHRGRVLIATAGGAGDVAPYTGLGRRLQASGHDVTIATFEPLGDAVRACGLTGGPRREPIVAGEDLRDRQLFMGFAEPPAGLVERLRRPVAHR